MPQRLIDNFASENVLQTVSPAFTASVLRDGPSATLIDLQGKLKDRIQKTVIEITAEIQSRLVFGIGCVAMILIGIGLGVVKKGGHLLSAFGASCVPAAVLIVCIMMGKNITKNRASFAGSGVLLMWLGLVVLVVLMVLLYKKLLKN